MTYTKEVYEKVRTKLEKRRRDAEVKAREVRNKFLAQNPRAEELLYIMGSTASKVAREVLRGGNVKERLEVLKEQNLKCQEEFSEILKNNGLERRDIEPDYACKECLDTGFKDGEMCVCFKELLKRETYEKLNSISPLEISRFEDFSLEYYNSIPYEEKKNMEVILNFTKKYASEFTRDSQNLLFTGSTGLGKTHLSLAIAGEIIEKGYGVVYGSMQSFASMIERERFAPIESGDETSASLISADLLIIDDLGAEFQSPYVTSVIYNIIDSRLMRKVPTIINTNLSAEELNKKYGERIVSRIFGNFIRFPFFGTDIRRQKLKNMRKQ